MDMRYIKDMCVRIPITDLKRVENTIEIKWTNPKIEKGGKRL